MELIRTPVIPMLTPTEEKLTEGEIVNINKGESIGVVRNGYVIDIIKNSTYRMLEDEAVAMSSNIKYSNSIGYFDKDDNVLMYKLYGIVINMNNSDCDGCVTPYTDFSVNIDIEDFLENFLGFSKSVEDLTGRTVFTMNNFFYKYIIDDGKILFLLSRGEEEGFFRAFNNDQAVIKFGTGIYDEDRPNEFTFKYFMLFNSLSWLLYKTVNMSHSLDKMKNGNLSEFFNRIINDTWINYTYDIERVPINSYISKFKISHDTITPCEFDGSDCTYFCTGYICTSNLENMMYILNNTLRTTSDGNQIKTLIEVI